MNYYVLDNGLRVCYYQMPNTHSITVGLYVKAGSAYEADHCNGITHLLEHMHFRKLSNYSQEELYYKMESIGSTLRATTYRDFLKFTMKVIPEKVDECMDIFQQIISTIEWTDEEIEKEKQVVKRQIVEKGNYINLDDEVRKQVFKNHGLSNKIMGDIHQIDNIKNIDLKKFKQEIFTAKNMIFYITGNIQDSKINDINCKLEKLNIQNSRAENKLFCPKYFCARKRNIYLKHVDDDNPLEINLSFDIIYDETNKDLLTILNCILGEGVGSLLQKRIREEKNYSADIASYIEWYSGFAVLHISFSTEKKWLLSCLEEIISVIREIKITITQKDLDVTLPFYTVNRVFIEDDTEEMNFQLAYNQFVLDTNYTGVSLENGEKTITELQNCAQELFVENNTSVVVLGNTRNITKKSISNIISQI